MLLLVLTLAVFMPVSANAAPKTNQWVNKGRYRYYYNRKGKKVKNKVKQIGNFRYSFDKKGRMQTGWQIFGSKKAYFSNFVKDNSDCILHFIFLCALYKRKARSQLMDDLDHKIIQLLAENARMPVKDIAQQVNLTSPAVSSRIHRLEQEGIIGGYTVVHALSTSAHKL